MSNQQEQEMKLRREAAQQSQMDRLGRLAQCAREGDRDPREQGILELLNGVSKRAKELHDKLTALEGALSPILKDGLGSHLDKIKEGADKLHADIDSGNDSKIKKEIMHLGAEYTSLRDHIDAIDKFIQL